jgi:hypothetical protein
MWFCCFEFGIFFSTFLCKGNLNKDDRFLLLFRLIYDICGCVSVSVNEEMSSGNLILI